MVKMRRSIPAALSSLAFLCAIFAGAVNGEDSIRMSFRYAFEDEGILADDRVPTRKEVEAVLCQTNVFYSKALQKELANPKLAVVTKEADYAFDDYLFKPKDSEAFVAMPAQINFTLAFISMDNSTLPSLEDITQILPTLDLNAYLINYVMRAAPNTVNFFYEARGIHWTSAIVGDVKGNITLPECPKGAQPEALTSPGTGEVDSRPSPTKETYAGRDDSSSNGFSLSLGFWDDKGREPTDFEWEALVCELDSFMNKQLQKGLQDDSISSYATDIVWNFDTEEYLPAQVNFSLSASFANGTDVPSSSVYQMLSLTNGAAANLTSKYINKAFPIGFSIFASVDKLVFRGATLDTSDPASTLLKASCPVTMHAGDQASFEVKVQFEKDNQREPTRDEIEAVMCETNKFFETTLRKELNDSSIVSYATNIDWTYDAAEEFQVLLTFTSTSLLGDGSQVRGAKVLETMEAADIQVYTEFYVLNAVPYERNLFFFSENLYFGGSVGQEVKPSKIPKGVQCKNYQDNRLAAFTIEVGFGNYTGIPTKSDVEGLMCQTNLFLEARLKEKLKDDSIRSHATNIDWDYDAGADLPAIVNFTAFSTYGDGSLISAKKVYDALETIDVPDFVQNYVWESGGPSGENIYYNTTDIMFGGAISAPVREGKLARVTCKSPVLSTANASSSLHLRSADPSATKKIDKEDVDKHYSQLPEH